MANIPAYYDITTITAVRSFITKIHGFKNLLNKPFKIMSSDGQASFYGTFNFRSGCLHVTRSCCYQVKLPNLKLKTWHIQLSGFLPLEIALTAQCIKFLVQILYNTDIFVSSTRWKKSNRGARKLMGENLEVVWAEFSTLS